MEFRKDKIYTFDQYFEDRRRDSNEVVDDQPLLKEAFNEFTARIVDYPGVMSNEANGASQSNFFVLYLDMEQWQAEANELTPTQVKLLYVNAERESGVQITTHYEIPTSLECRPSEQIVHYALVRAEDVYSARVVSRHVIDEGNNPPFLGVHRKLASFKDFSVMKRILDQIK